MWYVCFRWCAVVAATLLAACAGDRGDIIKIDGSSTVFPISQAVAEQYARQTGARITIGVSGTGGGFKKFCRGETDITGASRPIKPTERAACRQRGIAFIELPVAYDGLAVVVNPANHWVEYLTTGELERLWRPGSDVQRWSDLRPSWPARRITLLGPGADSGTYDYFTQAIVGKERASRADYTSSEDDNVLVTGVAKDPNALAFFGYGYYIENKHRLKLVPIDDGKPDNGAGPIAPSPATVIGGSYQPLSRPIFIYVNAAAAKRHVVTELVRRYLTRSRQVIAEVGYIPMPEPAYQRTRARFERFVARGTR